MSSEEMTQELYLRLEKQGYRGKIVSIKHLHDLQMEIEGHHRTGLFCEEFYQERLTWFDFKVPTGLPEAKSFIIVATPQPQVQVSFVLNGKSLSLFIPPTYSYSTDEQVRNLLASLLEPKGYSLLKTALPLKLLAVHSGLAQYGKNNITYVAGMGSFHRLVAFYTDFPCLEDSWGELRVMDHCKKCSACLKVCPTGAIASDRFLLHAEQCLTFHNERPGEFPTWIDSAWHNCLIGCLLCQGFCPVNKDFSTWIEEKAEFSHKETTLLLQGVSRDELPAETVRKLKQLGILEDLDVLPRNLSVLFERDSAHEARQRHRKALYCL
jgi:epoxyqueuosine reductase